jgi:hypothetical protein
VRRGSNRKSQFFDNLLIIKAARSVSPNALESDGIAFNASYSSRLKALDRVCRAWKDEFPGGDFRRETMVPKLFEVTAMELE